MFAREETAARPPRRSTMRSSMRADRSSPRPRSSRGSWASGRARRPSGWGSHSTPPPRMRSWLRSEDASSGCCESWRSSRWKSRSRGSPARERPGDRKPRRPLRRVPILCAGRRARRGRHRAGDALLPTRPPPGRAVGRADVHDGPARARGAAIALRLQAGESVGDVRRGLRMPPRAAERFVADIAGPIPSVCTRRSARSRTWSSTRAAGPRSFVRSPYATLDEDTIALHAIEVITS